MIISHKHRYLFIEIPLTASWAIRHELCEYCDGMPVLHKHASYPEFARSANAEERDYYVFATVRHPLDEVVSRYFKLQTDHNAAFSEAGSLKALRVDYADLEKYRFVSEGACFEDYFRRYHRRPFTGMIDLSRDKTDLVIRYERLQEGFSEVLQRLGIDQVRPVPMTNKTRGRRKQWQSYYPATITEQAKASFGPFMMEWGYRFPCEWGDYVPSRTKELEYRLVRILAGLYLTHFRYSQGAGARLARLMRAALVK